LKAKSYRRKCLSHKDVEAVVAVDEVVVIAVEATEVGPFEAEIVEAVEVPTGVDEVEVLIVVDEVEASTAVDEAEAALLPAKLGCIRE
jgi:hypothetical protein